MSFVHLFLGTGRLFGVCAFVAVVDLNAFLQYRREQVTIQDHGSVSLDGYALSWLEKVTTSAVIAAIT